MTMYRASEGHYVRYSSLESVCAAACLSHMCGIISGTLGIITQMWHMPHRCCHTSYSSCLLLLNSGRESATCLGATWRLAGGRRSGWPGRWLSGWIPSSSYKLPALAAGIPLQVAHNHV